MVYYRLLPILEQEVSNLLLGMKSRTNISLQLPATTDPCRVQNLALNFLFSFLDFFRYSFFFFNCFCSGPEYYFYYLLTVQFLDQVCSLLSRIACSLLLRGKRFFCPRLFYPNVKSLYLWFFCCMCPPTRVLFASLTIPVRSSLYSSHAVKTHC